MDIQGKRLKGWSCLHQSILYILAILLKGRYFANPQFSGLSCNQARQRRITHKILHYIHLESFEGVPSQPCLIAEGCGDIPILSNTYMSPAILVSSSICYQGQWQCGASRRHWQISLVSLKGSFGDTMRISQIGFSPTNVVLYGGYQGMQWGCIGIIHFPGW